MKPKSVRPALALIGLITELIFLSGCGVKSDPLPPLTPIELTRGGPKAQRSEPLKSEPLKKDETAPTSAPGSNSNTGVTPDLSRTQDTRPTKQMLKKKKAKKENPKKEK